MTDNEVGTLATYVLTTDRVRACVAKLLDRDTHQFFPAYLWLRRQAIIQGTTTQITPDWAGLATYMEVGGALPSKPFLRPFWQGQRNAGQEWLNGNLAGSYAPSSIRKKVRDVVATNADSEYILLENHWDRALEHLLFGQRLPALALAGFLLRDRGFVASSPPTAADLIAAFREEFRYGYDQDQEFNTLYETEWAPPGANWFEQFVNEEPS